MVNTFVLHPNLWVNSKLIDDKRLGKQRVEAIQILDILEGRGKTGWQNHPATNMWRGYEQFLRCYINSIISEWIYRGFDNNYPFLETIDNPPKPWWWYVQAIHFSHQVNLYIKMPFFYEKLKSRLNMEIPTIFDNGDIFQYYIQMGYIWPEKLTLNQKQQLLESKIKPHEIADPLSDHLINPKYCPAILISGKRRGEKCFSLLRGKGNYCGIHSRK